MRADEPTVADMAGDARLADVKRDMYKLLATTPDPNQLLLSSASRRRGHAAARSDDDDSQSSTSNQTALLKTEVSTSAPIVSGVDVYRQRLNKRIRL